MACASATICSAATHNSRCSTRSRVDNAPRSQARVAAGVLAAMAHRPLPVSQQPAETMPVRALRPDRSQPVRVRGALHQHLPGVDVGQGVAAVHDPRLPRPPHLHRPRPRVGVVEQQIRRAAPHERHIIIHKPSTVGAHPDPPRPFHQTHPSRPSRHPARCQRRSGTWPGRAPQRAPRPGRVRPSPRRSCHTAKLTAANQRFGDGETASAGPSVLAIDARRRGLPACTRSCLPRPTPDLLSDQCGESWWEIRSR
jgi:hypothetical protein